MALIQQSVELALAELADILAVLADEVAKQSDQHAAPVMQSCIDRCNRIIDSMIERGKD